MKTKKMMVMAVLVASALALGSESFARGGGAGAGSGAGGGRGQGAQTMTQTRAHSMNQSRTPSATQVRPEGSQRRDGSFLTTGTTANGSTTRPGNGRGVMDGTGINHPQSTTP